MTLAIEALEGLKNRHRRWFAAWILYASIAVAAGLIFPPALLAFLAPAVAIIVLKAPQARPVSLKVARSLIFVSAALIALWPVYLNLKIGPLPILTPPRAILYVLTAVWLYDMTVSPSRRARLCVVLRKSWPVTFPVAGFFLLSAISIPFAQGKAAALGELARQTIIWLLPFLAVATYVRRKSELVLILKLLAIAGAVGGATALVEALSGKLLASLLSPFIGDGQWLELAQEQKIRDGVFRAQAGHTHPLSLGEFMAFVAPLAFGFALRARTIAIKAGWLGAAVLVVGGAFAANSRAAMLCTAISILIFFTLALARQLRKPGAARLKPFAGLAALMLFAASPMAAGVGYKLLVGAGGEQAARSSQGRADQIERALPKILARPLAGYGVGRAAIVLGFWGNTLTIDNYYLTLALDLGIGGPLLFLSMLGGLGVLSGRMAGRSPPLLAAPLIGLMLSALAMAMTRSILSMTGNLSILYLVLAAAAGAAAYCRRARIANRAEPLQAPCFERERHGLQ